MIQMDVHARLVALVAEATSPAGALSSAARVIAEAFGADACSIFVRGENHALELRTHHGPAADSTLSHAANALAERALGDVLPATGTASGAGLLAVPVAAINQAIGAIVVRRSSASPFTAEEAMRMSGVGSQLVELIDSVRLIETIHETRHGRLVTTRAWDEESAPLFPGPERVLRGVAASRGLAMGTATFRNVFPRAFAYREAYRGSGAETARVRDGVEKTRNDLVRLQSAAGSEIGEEHALIFGAHLLLLNDPIFTSLVDQGISAGRTAAISVDQAFDELTRRLRDTSDPYIQERVEDLEDLRTRLLGYLVGVERQPALGARVVVTSRTTPSLVLELKARGALGVASELGGATSHGVLLARALGVPAVTGIETLTREVVAGDVLIIDGNQGVVVVRPEAGTRAEYERRSLVEKRRRTEFFRYRDRPPRTADGARFDLQANVALAADLAIARENRADGVGLYRTEFPFIARDALPIVEEQVRIYTRAYDTFPDGPIAFRLLDLASDKFIPSRELGVSRDAFHGYRSIRILFDHPHILRDQVQAFAAAAAGRELRILIPMVTSVEEVVRIKELVATSLAQASRPCTSPLIYGAMIETPAGAEIVTDLAREVDFFSLGTNDLIQYSLVVDRDDPRMSSERHAYHPAILRMIRRVVRHAHDHGRRVTVCGEMAARPDLAIALLALGVDALSVTPLVIPELKQALAGVPLEPLQSTIEHLLALPSAERIEEALRRYAREGKPLVAGGA